MQLRIETSTSRRIGAPQLLAPDVRPTVSVAFSAAGVRKNVVHARCSWCQLAVSVWPSFRALRRIKLMHRPIGVTLLAIGAGIAGLFQIWRMLVFLGVVKFNIVGREVAFQEVQWGQALLALM